MRRFGFPAELHERARLLLEELGYSWERPEELAAAIRRLSDFYIAQPTAATPWRQAWAQAAYLAYYLPLNYARNRAVASEAERCGFFAGLRSLVDFGSGPGTAQLAIADTFSGLDQSLRQNLCQSLCVDRSREPLSLHERLLSSSSDSVVFDIRWRTDLPVSVLPPPETRLAVFSYSLTELEGLPAWAQESEALILIEPSTREDGRRLLALRRELLEKGFFAYAPCTHNSPCPLLERSERDWCHDRIEWIPNPEWESVERHLPMRNRTVTYSYVLMRKTPREGGSPRTATQKARMVGDPLVEKGKTRQLVCRGPEREFLAWFPQRLSKEPELDRGDLVRLGMGLQTKSNELRIRDPDVDVVKEFPFRE